MFNLWLLLTALVVSVVAIFLVFRIGSFQAAGVRNVTGFLLER